MFSSLLLFANSLFFILRIAPGAGSFPKPLSAQEERDALERMAQGDAQARSLLIEHNLRLVAHVVKKYYAAKEDQDDLISIGTIGLIKAISSFDVSKGAKLATYAARCVENEILMHFRATKRQGCEVSLSDPIDRDKDGNALSLIDVISSDDNMLDEIDLSDRQVKLYRYMAEALDERERDILFMRYGLLGKKALTQREVAEKCGISRSYVSRIEKKALEKLARCFEDPAPQRP